MDDDAADLTHPAIKSARMTCWACPEQWDGELHDGRFFYFRYRWGRATLAIGPDLRSVQGVTGLGQVTGVDASMLEHGDRLRGCFATDDERSEVFARLFDHEHGQPW